MWIWYTIVFTRVRMFLRMGPKELKFVATTDPSLSNTEVGGSTVPHTFLLLWEVTKAKSLKQLSVNRKLHKCQLENSHLPNWTKSVIHIGVSSRFIASVKTEKPKSVANKWSSTWHFKRLSVVELKVKSAGLSSKYRFLFTFLSEEHNFSKLIFLYSRVWHMLIQETRWRILRNIGILKLSLICIFWSFMLQPYLYSWSLVHKTW